MTDRSAFGDAFVALPFERQLREFLADVEHPLSQNFPVSRNRNLHPMRQRQAALKPGDIAVALGLVLRPGERYEALSRALGLSLSAAHRAVRRLEAAQLLLPTDRHPNKSALLEFLVHGVRYAFPAQLGAEIRGVPTAGGLPEFRGEMPAGSGAVWPSVDGTVRGPSIVPLYEGAAAAALADARLHRLLALVDALRIGQARERRIAERLLRADLGIA